jgi:hypothetical protein
MSDRDYDQVTADAPRAGSIASQYNSRPTDRNADRNQRRKRKGTPAADANTVTIR